MSAADVSGGRAAKNNTTYFAKFTFVFSNVCFVKFGEVSRSSVPRYFLNFNGKLRNISVLVRIFSRNHEDSHFATTLHYWHSTVISSRNFFKYFFLAG